MKKVNQKLITHTDMDTLEIRCTFYEFAHNDAYWLPQATSVWDTTKPKESPAGLETMTNVFKDGTTTGHMA